MDRPTDELLQRMLAGVLATYGSTEQVDRLLAEARAEAESEVRELLKGAIKATLLQRAVSRLESPVEAFPLAPPDPDPTIEKIPDEADVGMSGETVCYVYGIIRAGRLSLPDLPGVDPRTPLELVRHHDLQAVTTNVSLDNFGPEAVAERVKDLDWVEQKVRAHDRVVKAMLEAGPVIPCRFCTILRSADDVRQVLERHGVDIVAMLDALDGRTEWGVKIYAARGAMTSTSASAEDGGETGGRAYFLRKKRDEIARGEAAGAVRAAAEACHAELAAAAVGAARLRISEGAAGGRETDHDLVLNGAYLVPDAEAHRFHATAGDLARRYASLGLSLDLTGPWPPYNFVSLDLSLEPDAPDGDTRSDPPLAHDGPGEAA
jgi:hypothetical protein